ncbi:MAG: nucleoside hydrolase, partial [Tepidisphaeraceae bacterium]
LYTAELCGSDVPVFVGAARPLLRRASHADWFHGKDGLGDMNYPSAKKRAQSEHAVDATIRTIQQNPGIEVVTLGPLTNVALAISREPGIVRGISRCTVMGGNPCCEGNVTPAAEYNIWCDPEAAAIVIGSGMNIELVGWHLCRGEANLGPADIAHVRAIDTKLAHFAMDCNRVAMQANRRQSGDAGIALPDPVAMSIALDPTICTDRSEHLVAIETHSDLTRGMTVVDRLNVGADERNQGEWVHAELSAGKAMIGWRIDVPRWKQMLYGALARG